MHGILEQMFEDLNSFAETSIRIDQRNYLDLKIFPYFPNPPVVSDWQVPVPLVPLVSKVEPNWDLTIAKVLAIPSLWESNRLPSFQPDYSSHRWL